MSSIGIMGLGHVPPTERVERIKKSFLSFMAGGKANDPGVIDLACRAAQRACEQAGLPPERVELILGTSASYTNFTGGSTQVAPRLSWGVHSLLKSSNAYAYDVCSTDGLWGLESAIAYVASGGRKNVLVVAADQFPEDAMAREEANHPPLSTGAAAAVVGRGAGGFAFVASAYENAKLPEQALRLDLIYGKGAAARPQGRIVMEHQDEGAVHLAQCAEKAYLAALDRAGLMCQEVHHIILPRWGSLYREPLEAAFTKRKKAFPPDFADVMITPAPLMDLQGIASRMDVGQRVAVIGYGFGSIAGCQIFQWQGWGGAV